jgi:hypothetical protein
MASSLQPNPSDATGATFVQPDWNSKNGVGTAVAIDASRSLEDIYDSQKSGEKFRAGVDFADPTVTSLSPATGTTAGGTVTTVTGDNLTGITSITFGGTAGTALTKLTDNTYRVTTPAKTAGAVTVVAVSARGNGTKANGFTYS